MQAVGYCLCAKLCVCRHTIFPLHQAGCLYTHYFSSVSSWVSVDTPFCLCVMMGANFVKFLQILEVVLNSDEILQFFAEFLQILEIL